MWIILLAGSTFLLYVGRSYIHRLVTFIWQDLAITVCCSLVALAVTATALNSLGVHPLSIPGMMVMGLVGCVIGALLLRWGETHS